MAQYKINYQYDSTQLKQLCTALTLKSAPAYKEAKQVFKPEVCTLNNYYILEEEINQHNQKKSEDKNSVKASWLAKLFKKSHQTGAYDLALHRIDDCCRYVSDNEHDSSTYFTTFTAQKTAQPNTIYYGYGMYNVYWKGLDDVTPQTLIQHDYNLELTPNGSRFTSVSTDDEVIQSVFIGKPLDIYAENAYVELSNNTEKIMLVFHVGIEKNKLDCLSALYLGVNNDPRPCATTMLLVKADLKLDNAVIEEYFNRYATNAIMKGRTITTMKKLVADLKKQEPPKLLGLVGCWLVYSNEANNMIDIGKLKIKTLTDISFQSETASYLTGKLTLKGTSKVILHLDHPERSATVMLSVGNRTMLNQLKRRKAVFASTGNDEILIGISVLLRVTEQEYEDAQINIIPKDGEQYNYLKGKGIIEDLKKHSNFLLSND